MKTFERNKAAGQRWCTLKRKEVVVWVRIYAPALLWKDERLRAGRARLTRALTLIPLHRQAKQKSSSQPQREDWDLCLLDCLDPSMTQILGPR